MIPVRFQVLNVKVVDDHLDSSIVIEGDRFPQLPSNQSDRPLPLPKIQSDRPLGVAIALLESSRQGLKQRQM